MNTHSNERLRVPTRRLVFPFAEGDDLFHRFLADVRAGKVFAYPTETVYGLGGDALNPETAERVYRLKGRDFVQPLLLLVRDRSMLEQIVAEVPLVAEPLIRAFWPGPLTLVFRKKALIPDRVTAGTEKIAVRISPDPVCRFLFSHLERPLLSTSANPSGQPPARTADEVIGKFGGRIPWVIDGGMRITAAPSTVLDVTASPPRILREGPISREAIRFCLKMEVA